MKRFFLALLVLVALFGITTLEQWFLMTPAARAQTNTFCAANLACTVTGAWTFSTPPVLGTLSTLTVSGTLNATNLQLTGPKVWIDVTNPAYGATGNGVTDDRTAIQAAITAVPATGAKVFLPCGNYLVKSNLLLPLNTFIEIVGEGQCTNLIKDFDSTTLIQSGSSTYGQQSNLSANIALGDQRLAVVSSTGFVVGNWIQIDDNNGTTANCTSYLAAEPVALSCHLELHQITAIPDGTHINIKESMEDTYTTAALGRVSVISPTFAKLHDFRVTHGPDCATANYCTGRVIDLFFPISTDVYNILGDIGKSIAFQQYHRARWVNSYNNEVRNGHDSLTRNGLGANAAIFDEGSAHWNLTNNRFYKFSEAVAQGQSHHFRMDNNVTDAAGDDHFNTHGSFNHDGSISGNVMGSGAFADTQNTVSARCVIISDTDFNMTVSNNVCRNWVTSCIQATVTTQFSIAHLTIVGNECSNPMTSSGTFPPNNFLSTVSNPPFAINLAGVDGVIATGNHIFGAFPANSVGFYCASCRNVLASGNFFQDTAGNAGTIGFYATTNAAQPATNYNYIGNVSRGAASSCFRWDLGSSTFAGLYIALNDATGCPGTQFTVNASITSVQRIGNTGDTAWFPTTAGVDLGAAATPFQNLWLGTAATNNFKLQPVATAAVRTVVMNDTNGVASVAIPWFGSAGTAGYQTKRVASCTTGAAAASTCTTTITWTTAFPDANYTAVCMIDGPTGVPYVLGSQSKAGASIVVSIANLTAVAASGTLNCKAQHD